jgi:hypothetical protein
LEKQDRIKKGEQEGIASEQMKNYKTGLSIIKTK